MKVAVATAGDQVSPHFGHGPGFTVADVEADGIKDKKYISNEGGDCQSIPTMLSGLGVKVAIVGGIGGGAVMNLQKNGIEVIGSASGSVDDVLEAFRAGTLAHGEVGCSHHDEHHDDGDHHCGH
ncbi:MAG: NifB/NifX family molybdenum-iron cluster-binding protein [Spirochaetales bacterium]|nr:NifB/NifX family molybdenum-iron cluster-binding protein [Spirochaetales bacterium]